MIFVFLVRSCMGLVIERRSNTMEQVDFYMYGWWLTDSAGMMDNSWWGSVRYDWVTVCVLCSVWEWEVHLNSRLIVIDGTYARSARLVRLIELRLTCTRCTSSIYHILLRYIFYHNHRRPARLMRRRLALPSSWNHLLTQSQHLLFRCKCLVL